MDEFRTVAKLWPSGTDLNLGTDSNLLGGPFNPTRQAAKFVTDGTNTYQFLFWNTGRHITSKRNVKWVFTVLGWGVWTATRWYGTPPTGPGGGPPRLHAEAFTISGDALIGATPIDGPASTFTPAAAFPFNGNDHEIGTAGGAAAAAAKDPYQNYDFAGWVRLVWGGDDTTEFVETDAGSGGSIGGVGFYDHVIGATLPAAQNESVDALATYGYRSPIEIPHRRFDDLRNLIYEVVWEDLHRKDFPRKGDPSPVDMIRLKFVERLVEDTQPPAANADFERLLAAAPTMTRDELKRSVQSLKTTLELGKATLATIESQLKEK